MEKNNAVQRSPFWELPTEIWDRIWHLILLQPRAPRRRNATVTKTDVAVQRSPFLELPTELWDRIWHLILLQPRVHRIRNATFTKTDVVGNSELCKSTADTRAALATCYRSRQVALAALPDDIPIHGRDGLLRTSFARDVISFDFMDTPEMASVHTDFNKAREEATQWMAKGRTGRPPKSYWATQVRNVGFEIGLNDWQQLCYTSHRFERIQVLPNFAGGFDSLESLYLVSRSVGNYRRKKGYDGGAERSCGPAVERDAQGTIEGGYFIGTDMDKDYYLWGSAIDDWVQKSRESFENDDWTQYLDDKRQWLFNAKWYLRDTRRNLELTGKTVKRLARVRVNLMIRLGPKDADDFVDVRR